MSADVDKDILVQRAAGELLADLRRALPTLLYQDDDAAAGTGDATSKQLRTFVSSRDSDAVLQTLDTFQESPQLLDPVLAELLNPLSEALSGALVFVRNPQQDVVAGDDDSSTGAGSITISHCVCRTLYSFCKVRGAKVVTRFLSNEARHIAPVVEALEARGAPVSPIAATDTATAATTPPTPPLSWEERYVLLLWLSHLILTPFPLASAGAGSTEVAAFPAKGWPAREDAPFVGRICRLAHFYLSSSGKERDAAVTLLVRVVLRPDMQRDGMLGDALQWARQQLSDDLNGTMEEGEKERDPYHIIGVLAFLAGTFVSADARVIASSIVPIFKAVQEIQSDGNGSKQSTARSAVGKKLAIKIYRSATLAATSLASSEQNGIDAEDIVDEILENVIGDLLVALGDQDAPVRFAASKALSVVATKLQEDMAIEVVEAVIASFDENVVRLEKTQTAVSLFGSIGPRRDLSLVSPFKWQGLTLTLAHLLFRRAPPPSLLPSILQALLSALSFEQRSTTGASVGNTVRDAANFGIWSIARRYTTKEILAIDPDFLVSSPRVGDQRSVLQIIACELVCTACLDPSGNIRRGASAALQELIGRHPDTILHGISVVQTVDYHAVSLLSKSMTDVALAASKLSPVYHQSLLWALMGWRGVYAADASTRRLAASSMSRFTEHVEADQFFVILDGIWSSFNALELRDIGNRHGLLMALAELLATFSMPAVDSVSEHSIQVLKNLWTVCSGSGHITDAAFTNFSLRPTLTAEGFCRLVDQLLLLTNHFPVLYPADDLITDKTVSYINLSLNLREPAAFEAAAEAACSLLRCKELGEEKRRRVVDDWLGQISRLVRAGPGRQATALGWLCALGRLYPVFDESKQTEARQLFVEAIRQKAEIETRVAALDNLRSIIDVTVHDPQITSAVYSSLQDYTTDQRGDVGSLARIAALECVKSFPESWIRSHVSESEDFRGVVCGLAVEKLDRVRNISFDCLRVSPLFCESRGNRNDEHDASLQGNTQTEFDLNHATSTVQYFSRVLGLATNSRIMKPMLLGLTTTVNGGFEAVSEACRAALADWLIESDSARQVEVLDVLLSILESHLADDRTVTGIIETIAYVMETRALSNIYSSDEAAPRFKSLFTLLQKAHLKSTLLPKLLAAVELYTDLGQVKCIQTSVRKKLIGMLVHPFPKVRQAAAEGLFCITASSSLLPVDWSASPGQLKTHIDSVRSEVLAK